MYENATDLSCAMRKAKGTRRRTENAMGTPRTTDCHWAMPRPIEKRIRIHVGSIEDRFVIREGVLSWFLKMDRGG
jgi:hypothetical protein